MKIDGKMADLICELEYIIGKQTYNPNSYNGWTGEEGCSYKYPVSFCKNKESLEKRELVKTKSKIKHVDVECIKTMKYAFGSNHLYVGDGLTEVLEFLEARYDINFNELEKARTQKRKAKMNELAKKLKKEGTVNISYGRWEIGVDIQVGEYIISQDSAKSHRWLALEVCNKNGDIINHIITDEKYVPLKLEKGNFLSLRTNCVLKKSGISTGA